MSIFERTLLADQYFASHAQWVNRASQWLTAHPRWNEGADYLEPNPFKATCFDSKGRLCRNGGDMARARDEDAFPVYWLWPDQIGPVLLAADVLLNEATVPA